MLGAIFGTFISTIIGLIIVYFINYRFIAMEDDDLQKAAEENVKIAKRKKMDQLHRQFLIDLVIERDLYKKKQ